MNNTALLEEIREDELQSELDTEHMNYITNMVRYVLNPQDKLPPKIKENNLGFVLAQNLLNLGVKFDFESGILNIDKNIVTENFGKIQELLGKEFIPDNNLTYYPLYLIKTSNSSKFIHGLPYNEIMHRWHNDFEQNPEKLKCFIEDLRPKLHIDEELEIVSAKVIDHQIYLRIKIDNHDVTIPLGYSTKHKKYNTKDGKEIELIDGCGNMFSPKGVKEIEYYLSDEEIENFANISHEQGAKFMMNFYAWRAPEYVTEENYKHYYYDDVEDSLSDEEAIQKYGGVLHHFKEGKRVIIHQVNEQDGHYIPTTQDQILPNFGKQNGNKQEKENYNYWKNTYQKELFRLVDLGVDTFRIDLAHGFHKDGECNLLHTLFTNTIEYAEEVCSKKIFFVLETYDFRDYGGTEPAHFRDWNNNLSYPAVKVYYKDIEGVFANLRNEGGLEKLINVFTWLFQDIRGIYGEMGAITSFDDNTLRDIAEKSGIDYKYILELQLLLGKASYNILSPDRDFQGKKGEFIPVVGGHEKIKGTGDMDTHCLAEDDEVQEYIDNDSKINYEEVDGMKKVRKIKKYGEIKGLNIDKNNKTITFTFNNNNNKRIFDFQSLINGGEPYSIESDEKFKMLSESNKQDLEKLNNLKKELAEKLKKNSLENALICKKLPNVYNFEFWLDFANYVKQHAWDKYEIEEWDIHKQETYFLLNRDKLIKNFLSYKKISQLEENNNYNPEHKELSEEINNLRKTLQVQVKEILKKSIKDKYPDLI